MQFFQTTGEGEDLETKNFGDVNEGYIDVDPNDITYGVKVCN